MKNRSNKNKIDWLREILGNLISYCEKNLYIKAYIMKKKRYEQKKINLKIYIYIKTR